jgi:hypothetical protein
MNLTKFRLFNSHPYLDRISNNVNFPVQAFNLN